MKYFFYKTLNLCIPIIGSFLLCTSCDSYSTSAPDDKYLSEFHNKYFQYTGNAVSYTHLTLPTICSV